VGVFEGVETSGLRHERPVVQRCGDHVLCQTCRNIRRFRAKKAMEEVVPRALEARRLQCSRYYRGPEGRWGPRMLTLTVPHSGVPADDARAIRTAWRRFSQLVWEHLKKDRGCELQPIWVRVLEIAAKANAAGGHVHLHVWWLGPFLDSVLAAHLWGRALAEHGVDSPKQERGAAINAATDKRVGDWFATRRGPHGRPLAEIHRPVVDVTGDKGGRTAQYATKMGLALYAVKGSELERMHPLHAAASWEALRSVRVLQWSRGWAPNRERDWKYHFIRRHSPDENAHFRAETAPSPPLRPAELPPPAHAPPPTLGELAPRIPCEPEKKSKRVFASDLSSVGMRDLWTK
jgi:hypothetical protein